MARAPAVRQNAEMKTKNSPERIADEMIGEVEPVLRKYAAQAEADRRLAPEAINAILDAGLMRTWTPKAYGGLEVDPISAFKMFEAIGRIDSAAGGIVANSIGISSFSWLPFQRTQESRAVR